MQLFDALRSLKDIENPERYRVYSDELGETLYPDEFGNIDGCSILQEWLEEDDWEVIEPKHYPLTVDETLHLLKTSRGNDIVVEIDGKDYKLIPRLRVISVDDGEKSHINFKELKKVNIYRVL